MLTPYTAALAVVTIGLQQQRQALRLEALAPLFVFSSLFHSKFARRLLPAGTNRFVIAPNILSVRMPRVFIDIFQAAAKSPPASSIWAGTPATQTPPGRA
ncbi:MAG: hypothetical protein ACK4TA_07810 [Saprospiraceae bacterium]